MRRTAVVASSAVLALGLAACGDDDDDDGDDAAAQMTTATGDGATTAAGGAATTTAPGAAVTDDPQVAEDCQALLQVPADAVAEEVPTPSVGEQISDEYKDFVRSSIEQLDDIELESDAVEDAADQLVDFGEDVLDADTWTDDLESRSQNAFQPILDVCGASLTGAVGASMPPLTLPAATAG